MSIIILRIKNYIDTRTERCIQNAMDELMQGRTSCEPTEPAGETLIPDAGLRAYAPLKIRVS